MLIRSPVLFMFLRSFPPSFRAFRISLCSLLSRPALRQLLGLAAFAGLHAMPAAALTCETVPSLFDQTPDNTISLTIGPDRPGATWGNTYFMLPKAYQAVRIRMKQLSSDVGLYPVKLIVRYSDDTIYEFLVDPISPVAGREITWGPWSIRDPQGQKIPDMFNVKVQENYALTPAAKGFAYTLTVEGCS